MNGFVIKYKDMYALLWEFKSNLEVLITTVDSYKSSLANLISTSALNGKTSKAIASYFDDVHMTCLSSISTIAQTLLDNMIGYKVGYYSIDTSTNFVLPEEVINRARELYNAKFNDVEEQKERINSSLDSISSIEYYGYPSDGGISEEHEAIDKTLKDLVDNINSFEESTVTSLTNSVEQLITLFTNSMNALNFPIPTDASKYVSGSFYTNPDVYSLAYLSELCYNNHKENEEFLNTAWEQETAMKEAAEDRETAGIWKTIGGVALIVTGVACIVVTCGAATPAVVIGGTAIGGTTVLFGTADAIEGGQDIYYGTVGDINTKSFNYIRDTVFFGNEKVYGITENVFAFAASAAIPIGAAYGEIGKMSFRTVGTIIGEEIISDQAGNLANMAVNEVGEYFNWNDDVTRVLSMGAGMLASNTTSNGLVSLDKKLNFSRNFPDIKTNIPETPFKYKHNPSDNPKVLQDALENPNAVYGYSPNPKSNSIGGYATKIDWSDPISVKSATERRINYHINNENGPTAEFLYNKYGSWETVIEKSMSANPGMDACCGLYDKYFHLYDLN